MFRIKVKSQSFNAKFFVFNVASFLKLSFS
jgi:hypothetical protein